MKVYQFTDFSLFTVHYSLAMVQFPGTTICADGSDRRFERIAFHGKSAVRILPPDTEAGIREAHSFFHIGTHLFKAGLPVPDIYDFDGHSGILIVEDLGDTLMYHAVLPLRHDDLIQKITALYKDAITLLCDFQWVGTRHFDTRWCFDTPEYNSGFAWEREATYFLDSFLVKHCGIVPEESMVSELKQLCSMVDEQRKTFCLMHRDFQSRNIMIQQGRLRIIDFQGARPGPWGYDLASLVFDPYMDLPEDIRQELVGFYFDKCGWEITREQMAEDFHVTALLRTLQVLGAFSFLSRERQKPFFIPFIEPAVRNLHYLAFRECFSHLTELRLLSTSLMELSCCNAGSAQHSIS